MTTSAVRRGAAALALTSAAVLAAACGHARSGSGGGAPASSAPAGGAASASPAPSSASSSPSASPTSNAVAAGCATSSLRAKVVATSAGATAGSVYYPITFTNVSASACTLYGYPGVSFVTGPSGQEIGSPAGRNPTLAAAAVTLAPGGVAHATMQIADAGNYTPSQCQPVTARWLRIYPPNQTAPLYVRFTAQICSGQLPAGVGRQISVEVVSAGPGGNGS